MNLLQTLVAGRTTSKVTILPTLAHAVVDMALPPGRHPSAAQLCVAKRLLKITMFVYPKLVHVNKIENWCDPVSFCHLKIRKHVSRDYAQ